MRRKRWKYFRGIIFVSCLSKLFTVFLNKKVNNLSEKYNDVSGAQFEFKKVFFTVDAIYSFHSLVQNMLNNNTQPLFCAFVDLKKAFDPVYHNALRLNLYKMEINGKMLRIICAVYDSVKCCVRHCGSYSDFFEVSVGLKQGETLSHILFSLFIEDLQGKPSSGLNIKGINLLLFLLADDMVILGETPEDLQGSLNGLHKYCDKWELEVNTSKTYLGVVLNYTGVFCLNQQTLSCKALLAMNILLQNSHSFDCHPKPCCQLFDAFVASILSYSCKVWGYSNSKHLERFITPFPWYRGLPSIFKDRSVTSSIPAYFQNSEPPIICYKYNKPIRNTVFNFNKLVSDLDIHANTPES